MKLLSRIRTRRRMVLAVLATWLFALSAGFANACMLQDHGTHVHRQAQGATVPYDAPVVISAGHIGIDSVHDDGKGAGGKACLKVCDDGTQSVVTTPSSFDLTDAALAPPTVTLWTARAVELQIVGIATPAAPPPAAGPPLRTRLSRLAL
jgi:hypothetical protein